MKVGVRVKGRCLDGEEVVQREERFYQVHHLLNVLGCRVCYFGFWV